MSHPLDNTIWKLFFAITMFKKRDFGHYSGMRKMLAKIKETAKMIAFVIRKGLSTMFATY